MRVTIHRLAEAKKRDYDTYRAHKQVETQGGNGSYGRVYKKMMPHDILSIILIFFSFVNEL